MGKATRTLYKKKTARSCSISVSLMLMLYIVALHSYLSDQSIYTTVQLHLIRHLDIMEQMLY